MPENERPLPKPPSTPFGRKKRIEQEETAGPLMADELAMAAVEGRLDEFMKREMPDNEYAQALTMMMMGMTGMMPPEGATSPQKEDDAPAAQAEERPVQEHASFPHPPEDVVNAVNAGDVKGLMELLRREYKKMNPDSGIENPEEAKAPSQASVPDEEKAVLDQLISISKENGVSLDWTILRALKLYLGEYRKTGRL